MTPASSAAPDPRTTAPGGWRLDRDGRGASLAIDPKNPHSGSQSLRMEVRAGPASVVSGEFQPGPGVGLMLQAYLRAEEPATPVKVWIEGESGGRPFVRRSEVVATADWKPILVKVSDLPPAGLESARIRFESPAAATLWIDDVRVRTEAAPKPVRINAQRTLLAALQAYRERRYAEFSRLADSHWARHPGILALVRGERTSASSPDRPREAEASALPSDRTLR